MTEGKTIMDKKSMTMYEQHVQRWSNCQACGLCLGRKTVVIARGTVPCDVLFIGEAPGESEDCLGKPFVGPAGQLLDMIIKQARGGINWTYAMTNLVCCIPREDDGSKTREPPDDAVEACKPRLVEFITLASPRLIVCVGKLAKDWLDPDWKKGVKLPEPIPQVDITHPAAILRANISQRGLAVQRCVVILQNAIEDHVLTGGAA